ncbi:GGDEF domain-containing protein [Lichenicoccus sp.]|uniref:GGDEF domain-containing protein n=1 Tax=Lichenicoccus sp. TaxID=2781899 RepID=UPI003D0EA419
MDQCASAMAKGLLDTLYTRDRAPIHGAIVSLIAACIGYGQTGCWWILAWGLMSLPLAASRLLLTRAYWRLPDRVDLRSWTVRYLVLAWLAGALWGSVSLAIPLYPDPRVALLIVVCQMGFVAGGIMRNSAVPRVVTGQVLLTLVPLLLACLATGQTFFMLFGGLVLLHTASSLSVIRFSHERIVALLRATAENAEFARRLGESNRRLETMAETDALTQLLNRRGFDLHLRQACERAARERTKLSMLLLDVDHFKLFNDRYGHLSGDDCLRRIAAGMVSAVRCPQDLAARYGGEEFALILPDTDESGALTVAQRVLAAVAALDLAHAGSSHGQVTVSIGIARFDHEIDAQTSLENLVRDADAALYRAKHLGRNRIAGVAMAATCIQGMQQMSDALPLPLC